MPISEAAQDAEVSISDAPRPSLTAFSKGNVLGGVYRIRAPLVQGTAGRMYEADDLILNRRVAIKVPRSGTAGKHLLDEARLLAALSHPGLPEVHAAGRHGDMRFLVMELLVGVTLEQHRARSYEARHAIGIHEAVDVLVDICGALHALHGAGIAHRDVKPDNVMLCGERGTVLIDFGLVASEANVASASETLAGASPLYLAPEELRGCTARGGGHLADIYSFGVVAYELLTGSVPFNASDIPTLTRLHADAPIPDARVLRPNLPAQLAELIVELMAKQPGERPQAMDEVLWRLRSVQGNLPRGSGPMRKLAMIVSDDLGFCGELQHRLDHWVSRVEVVVHHSCRDLLKALEHTTPQLLLFDQTIGDMTVIDLLKKMKASKFAGPEAMVLLAASVSADDLDALRKIGVRSIMPRGRMMGAMLEPIVRNVLAANPRA